MLYEWTDRIINYVGYGKYADVLNLFERTFSFDAFWNENIAFNLKSENCLFFNSKHYLKI